MGFLSEIECHSNNTIVMEPFLMALVLRSRRDEILVSIIQPIIAVIGQILNGVFIALVFNKESFKSTTNIYLGHLAIADSIFSTYSATINLVAWIMIPFNNERSFMGPLGCIFNEFIPYACYYTSLFLVTVVTIERYLAICDPMRHRQIVTKRLTLKLVTACWIGGLIFAVPSTFQEGKYFPACVVYPRLDSSVFRTYLQGAGLLTYT